MTEPTATPTGRDENAAPKTPDVPDAFDVFARSCPSRTTLEHVTGRGAL